MAVDEDRSLGFVTGQRPNENYRLHLMDLERLVEIDSVIQRTGAATAKSSGWSPETSLALDPVDERLYTSGPRYPGVADLVAAKCDPLIGGRSGLIVFEYRRSMNGPRTLKDGRIGPLPCWGSVQFMGLTVTSDPEAQHLYVGGVPITDGWRNEGSTTHPAPEVMGGLLMEDRGQPLLLRQLRVGDGPLLPLAGNAAGVGAAPLELDWGLDLRLAGCGRREPVSSQVFEGFVARLGREILVYCWDARPYRGLQQGQQGYLVRIPLEVRDGVLKPRTRGPELLDPGTNDIVNYSYRRVPTLPGKVTPILDRVSGRLILVTADVTNGNAAWVFDPLTERFVGVITGGYADQPRGNTAVGFDSRRGRVYVLTQHGILVAPVRADPLPAGLIYPVLVNKDRREDFVTSDRISVAPRLGRLFVAVNDYNDMDDGTQIADHYEVLQDDIPDPPRLEPVDPDALTTDVNEENAETTSATGAEALASGVHSIATGGLTRAVGQTDPTCLVKPPNLHRPTDSPDQTPVPDWELAPAIFGSCLPEVLATSGHREAFTAATDVEVATGGGAVARGTPFTVGSADAGTDGDVRRLSDCAVDTPARLDRWGRRWPFPEGARLNGGGGNTSMEAILSRDQEKRSGEDRLNAGRDAFWQGVFGSEQFQQGQAQYRGGCNDFQDRFAEASTQAPTGPVDLRAGTKGADGKGFPIRAAVCGDFGGTPSAETWPEQSAGAPQAGYPTSSVSCDASVPRAQGTASAGALALPSAADPQLTVARVSSRVTSMRTPDEGQVTMAFASASGVTVGPLSIAEVRSLAITKAAGRAGTTDAVLIRQWCGISVAGQSEQGCVDPTSQQAKDLLDEVSAALLQKIQLSVPEGFTQKTPKGYQAVVTKSPGQRGADQTVNDDDSHTVSALQAVIYNDGPRGRSRLVVQLAGVHAESRYGIIELPNFSTGPEGFERPPVDGDVGAPVDLPAPDLGTPDGAPVGPTPDTFTPDSFFEEDFGGTEEFVRFSAPPPRTVTVPGPRGSPVEQIVRVPVRVVSDAINLLVQNPREAALLFVMFALLAAPVYLGLRRRSFARAVLAN